MKDKKTFHESILLFIACTEGDYTSAIQAIENGADVNFDYVDFNSRPIAQASSMGHLEIVELLIKKGAHVQYETKGNQTPLILAIKRGHEDVAEFLIYQSDLNFKDRQGFSALTWALQYNQINIIKSLLERGKDLGLDVNFRDSYGMTPLMIAAIYCGRKIVELLIRHGSNVDAIDSNGDNALMLALKEKKFFNCEPLMKESTVNVKNYDGDTPLSIATKKEFNEIAELLVEKGAIHAV